MVQFQKSCYFQCVPCPWDVNVTKIIHSFIALSIMMFLYSLHNRHYPTNMSDSVTKCKSQYYAKYCEYNISYGRHNIAPMTFCVVSHFVLLTNYSKMITTNVQQLCLKHSARVQYVTYCMCMFCMHYRTFLVRYFVLLTNHSKMLSTDVRQLCLEHLLFRTMALH